MFSTRHLNRHPSSAMHASLSTACSSKASAMSNTSSNDTRPWVSVIAYLCLFVFKIVCGKSTRYTSKAVVSSTRLSTLTCDDFGFSLWGRTRLEVADLVLKLFSGYTGNGVVAL